jgi:hypothetical protein
MSQIFHLAVDSSPQSYLVDGHHRDHEEAATAPAKAKCEEEVGWSSCDESVGAASDHGGRNEMKVHFQRKMRNLGTKGKTTTI